LIFGLPEIRWGIILASATVPSEFMDPLLKGKLKQKGWKLVDAAAECGVTVWHLSRVLNGHRESARLEKAIDELPSRVKKAEA
jgi:hypothetical protein